MLESGEPFQLGGVGAEVDFSGRLKQIAVAVAGGSREWLTVSRRGAKMLRRLLGLPAR